MEYIKLSELRSKMDNLYKRFKLEMENKMDEYFGKTVHDYFLNHIHTPYIRLIGLRNKFDKIILTYKKKILNGGFTCSTEGCGGLLTRYEYIGGNPKFKHHYSDYEYIQHCDDCGTVQCKLCNIPYGDKLEYNKSHDFKTCEEIYSIMARSDDMHEDTILLTIGRKCPSCKTIIIKRDGCNHISCRCGTHFCYACCENITHLDITDSVYTHWVHDICEKTSIDLFGHVDLAKFRQDPITYKLCVEEEDMSYLIKIKEENRERMEKLKLYDTIYIPGTKQVLRYKFK